MVKEKDLVGKCLRNGDYIEIYECVCANEAVFVLGKSNFSVQGRKYKISGFSLDCLKAYKNDEATLKRNGLVLLND
jgi:hypothetical protein